VRPVALINLFEVPPAAEDEFLGDWDRARAFVRSSDGFIDTALHRSHDRDADFRFVNIARFASVDAWRHLLADPAFPGRVISFPAHPGLYDVVFEEGEPDHHPGVGIEPFDVAADAERQTFTGPWREEQERRSAKPGYAGSRLYECVGTATFRFVAVTWWRDGGGYEVIRR
jgi:heme-degrading monooxygenase HmoA